MDHLADVSRDPRPLFRREPEPVAGQFALQDHRAGHVDTGHLPPIVEEFVNPLASAGRLRTTNDHGHAPACGGEVSEQ